MRDRRVTYDKAPVNLRPDRECSLVIIHFCAHASNGIFIMGVICFDIRDESRSRVQHTRHLYYTTVGCICDFTRVDVSDLQKSHWNRGFFRV